MTLNKVLFREVYLNKIKYCFGSLYLFDYANKIYSHWDSYRKSNIVSAKHLRLEENIIDSSQDKSSIFLSTVY